MDTHISFLDFPESEAVRLAVENRIEKLAHFYERIVSCHVYISCPHRHRHTSDRIFRVLVRIHVPKKEIITGDHASGNESHTDIYIAITDAFDAAERILQDYARIRRNDVKAHERTQKHLEISQEPADEDNISF